MPWLIVDQPGGDSVVITKRCVVLRHVEYEGIAGYRAPIEAAGFAVERLAAWCVDFADFDPIAPDLLVIMGGPMGVYDAGDHPWIGPEVDAIAARIAAGRPTLGICLGAQMIAAALGSAVYPGNAGRELGFSRLTYSAVGQQSPVGRIAEVEVLHWHGDTFDLPCDVELLASTDRYPNQAFRRGANLLALQFHAEMGRDPRFEHWLGDLPEAERAHMAAEHERLGHKAVAAGQAMMIAWLSQLEPR